MLILLFIGLSFALNCTFKTQKEDLLPCILTADTNNDYELNATEITNFITLHHLEKVLNLNFVLSLCDDDKNGKLTIDENRCINPYVVCIYCEILNLNKK